ncbi:putative secreted protein [Litoreibacter ponti]|uniref:Putative secreted protein n=1 Tax=Litoreibacter ponti TaxID=1510457 RepID=A0A2T6BIY6_9RHOB|nr:VPLPA-CTERM sorting domain-containing protein [Litoreibacter ponti]PTX56018.1 putative secreted protein [Litoreibacter ponti]
MKTIFAAALVAATCSAASAATFTYTFTAVSGPGTNDSSFDSTVDVARALTEISGTLVLDDTLLRAPTANIAFYAAPVVTIDGFDMTLFDTLPFELGLGNDVGNPIVDGLGASTVAFNGIGISNQLTFGLIDSTATAFSSNAFPTVIDLGAFDIAEISLFSLSRDANGRNGAEQQIFDITELDLVEPVPLPATALLLLAGVGGLGALRRRRKSRD